MTTSRHREYNRYGRDPELLSLYGKAPWKRFRAWVKADRIFCERCKRDGRLVPGQHVDHLIDPRERPDLTYDPANVQYLCQACHNAVTAERKRKRA